LLPNVQGWIRSLLWGKTSEAAAGKSEKKAKRAKNSEKREKCVKTARSPTF
jgi:hypothetical protein